MEQSVESSFLIEDLESRLEMAQWTASTGAETTTTTANGSVKTESSIGVKISVKF